MNKKEAKKKAYWIAYHYIEMASNSGVIADYTDTEKDYEKVQKELDIIRDRCYERAESNT